MDPAIEGAKQGAKAVSIMGWVWLILGVLAIVFPFAAGASFTMAIGILLGIAGVGAILDGWKGRKHGGTVVLIIGVLTFITGMLFFMRPLFGMAMLTALLIAYFLVSGIGTLIGAFQLKPAKGWGFYAFDGAVSLLLGLMLWGSYPDAAAWLIGLLLGIRLIFTGLVIIITGKTMRGMVEAVETMQENAASVEAEVLESRDSPAGD